MVRPVVGSSGWGTTLNTDLDGIEAGASVSGTGSPEGVVTAGIGKTYRDTAATNGAVLWVKAVGTGNTGWQVVSGDTGWRTVALLAAATGTARLRRIGGVVHCAIATTAANGYVEPAVNLPTGWHPTFNNTIVQNGFGTLYLTLAAGDAGRIALDSTPSSGGDYRPIPPWPVNTTLTPWPATLIGTTL